MTKPLQKGQLRERLLQIIDSFKARHLAVVGDLIADEFLYGQVSRVSREAPVLVLYYRDTDRIPGGAANAANNLLELGCRVTVVGVVGRDPAGRDLIRQLSCKGADVARVYHEGGYATPVKTRILAGAHHSAPQQIVRVDRIGMSVNDRPVRWERPERVFRGVDGIILSDYGYGMATPQRASELASFCRSRRLPVVVDSRFRMSEFCGVTSLTPNITELEAARETVIGGDAALLARIGRRVVREQGLSHLLVTQGRFGMTLFHPPRAPLHLPIFGTDQVADVTGAGDTVIAVFTLSLACGATPEESARLSNYAGGIVVMKRGTATLTPDELTAAVRQDRSI